MEALGHKEDNPLLRQMVKNKLPQSVLAEMVRAERAIDPKKWSMAEMRKSLAEIVSLREEVVRCSRPFRREDGQQQQFRQAFPKKHEPARVFAAVADAGGAQGRQQNTFPPCLFCDQRHWAADCTRVRAREARIRILNQQQRCLRCLRKHNLTNCFSKRNCVICQEPHHKAVCPRLGGEGNIRGKGSNKEPLGRRKTFGRVGINALAQTGPNSSEAKVSEAQLVVALVPSAEGPKANGGPGRVLLMATKVWVGHGSGRTEAEALVFFDIGSQVTLIKRALVERLSLEKVADDQLEVMPFQARRPLRLKAPQFSLRLLGPLGESVPVVAHRADWIVPSVRRAECHDGILVAVDEEPDILVGMGDFWSIFRGVEEVGPQMPGIFRVLTSLGPVLCGRENLPMGLGQGLLTSVMSLPGKMEGADPETDQMKSFWDLQMIGITEDPRENEDETAARFFADNFRRLTDGRYEAGWPWKVFPPKLQSNFLMAYRRLASLLEKLQKTPELLMKYEETMQKQLQLGYIEPAGRTWGIEHFLPHHHVVTKKLRVVFDASAHGRGEPSLNDCIFRGPVMMPDLVGILMRFRLGRFAMWADLESAFLQISLPERDREVCKFLWVVDPSKPPTGTNLKFLRWARVPFGVIASPFLLAAVVQRHLEKKGTPLAKEYAKNAYVDNLLTLCETEEEALDKYQEGKQIFAEAKMNLREFICNSDRVMAVIPEEDRLDKTSPKVLGIPWDPRKDKLAISFPVPEKGKVTKRIILKELASVFDPLGFCCPCLLEAKLFMQKLWERQLGWDEPLPEVEAEQWRGVTGRWATAPISLPRRGVPSLDHAFQLHVFVDASKDAFAAALYLRAEAGGQAAARLFFGKSRVKPRKVEVTIPRMELLAMLIGARALRFAEAELNLPITSKFIWGDSKPVLSWVASQTTQPRFVENRLKEIRRLGADARFKYVPTEENPADVASRGCSPEELREHPLWWQGPPWLTKGEAHWPSDMEVRPPEDPPEEDTPLPGTVVAVAKVERDTGEAWIDPTRFSSWERLVRATVAVRHFLGKKDGPLYRREAKGENKIRHARSITAEEFELAEKCLLKLSQARWPVVSQGKADWKAGLDGDGLLRVETRLGHSTATMDFKKPVVLSAESPVTMLLIQRAHQSSRHAGVEATLTAVLARFWIPKARATVKKMVRSCRRCRRVQGPAFALPLMPHLPADRVVRLAPFASVGIDYLGPTQTRMRGGPPEKAWIVLITCLSVRAVYLEPVPDLSAASFLQVLRRFASRRGTPQRIMCDNGTQFVLAAKAAAGVEAGRVPRGALDDYLAREGIRWRFIPQISPWQGGVYERLVALVKAAFKRVLGRRILNWDELVTFTAEVEASLNQRPLTHVDEGADGCLPLRPVDFIAPEAKLGVETGGGEGPDLDEEYRPNAPTKRDELIKRWQATTELLDSFWLRWQTEYLLMLRHRLQWKHKGPKGSLSRQPEVGEVVLIEEDKQPRNIWPIGRVMELLGQEGAVRNVRLKMANGKILSRPVSRLFPLEVGEAIEAGKGGTEAAGLPTPDLPTAQAPEAADEEQGVDGGQEKDASQTRVKGGRRGHGMLTRAKARLLGAATSAFVCLMLLLMATSTAAIGPAKNSWQPPPCRDCQLECLPTGVGIRLPPRFSKFEICCGEASGCFSNRAIPRLTYEVPKDELLVGYRCSVTYWDKRGRPWEGGIECPPMDECQILGCWLCWERLANPDCRPGIALGFGGVIAFSALWSICCFFSLVRNIFSNGWVFCRCLVQVPMWIRRLFGQRNADGEEAGQFLGSQRQSSSRRNRRYPGLAGRLSRLAAVGFVLASLLGTVDGEAGAVSLTATSESCWRTEKGSVCKIESSTEVTLLPAGQPVRLVLRGPREQVLGVLEITMESLTINCLPRSEKWMRSYRMVVNTVKSCPTEGSCQGNYCCELGEEAYIPELGNSSYEFPGYTKCTESCSFWHCGCRLPGASCLFYRPQAVPASEKVYELLSCPRTEHRVGTQLKMEIGGNVTQETATALIPGVTFRWRNVSLTPVAISQAPAPILSGKFITDGGAVALAEDVHSDLYCPDQEAAESLRCRISQDSCPKCTKEHEAETVYCSCRDSILENIMEDPEKRLPLNTGPLSLRNSGREVFAETGYAPVQLLVQFDGLRLATEEDLSKCSVEAGKLHGCYSCQTGGVVAIKCQTDFGSALADVRCDDGMAFTMQCRQDAAAENVSLNFPQAEVDTICKVHCSGGISDFRLRGHLRYVPRKQQSGFGHRRSANLEKVGKWWSWPPDFGFDWWDVAGFFFSFPNILWTAAVILAAIVAAWLFFRLNPVFRVWRLAGRYATLILFTLPFVPISASSGGWPSSLNDKALIAAAPGGLGLVWRPNSFANSSEHECSKIRRDRRTWAYEGRLEQIEGKHRRTLLQEGKRGKRALQQASDAARARGGPRQALKEGEKHCQGPLVQETRKSGKRMVTLASFLSHWLEMEPGNMCAGFRLRPGTKVRVEEKLAGMLEEGYVFKTNHLQPQERNMVLRGTRVTDRGAENIGAFGGRGPDVATYMRQKHGVRLRHPRAPCLVEPWGPRTEGFFPFELIRVITPNMARGRVNGQPGGENRGGGLPAEGGAQARAGRGAAGGGQASGQGPPPTAHGRGGLPPGGPMLFGGGYRQSAPYPGPPMWTNWRWANTPEQRPAGRRVGSSARGVSVGHGRGSNLRSLSFDIPRTGAILRVMESASGLWRLGEDQRGSEGATSDRFIVAVPSRDSNGQRAGRATLTLLLSLIAFSLCSPTPASGRQLQELAAKPAVDCALFLSPMEVYWEREKFLGAKNGSLGAGVMINLLGREAPWRNAGLVIRQDQAHLPFTLHENEGNMSQVLSVRKEPPPPGEESSTEEYSSSSDSSSDSSSSSEDESETEEEAGRVEKVSSLPPAASAGATAKQPPKQLRCELCGLMGHQTGDPVRCPKKNAAVAEDQARRRALSRMQRTEKGAAPPPTSPAGAQGTSGGPIMVDAGPLPSNARLAKKKKSKKAKKKKKERKDKKEKRAEKAEEKEGKKRGHPDPSTGLAVKRAAVEALVNQQTAAQPLKRMERQRLLGTDAWRVAAGRVVSTLGGETVGARSRMAQAERIAQEATAVEEAYRRAEEAVRRAGDQAGALLRRLATVVAGGERRRGDVSEELRAAVQALLGPGGPQAGGGFAGVPYGGHGGTGGSSAGPPGVSPPMPK